MPLEFFAQRLQTVNNAINDPRVMSQSSTTDLQRRNMSDVMNVMTQAMAGQAQGSGSTASGGGQDPFNTTIRDLVNLQIEQERQRNPDEVRPPQVDGDKVIMDIFGDLYLQDIMKMMMARDCSCLNKI
jgi:hypothetical protein